VVGKTLFFVNSIDRGYSLKLFFEQFGVRAGVLNAQLPANSRKHILDSYEAGLFDHLIATDEAVGCVVFVFLFRRDSFTVEADDYAVNSSES
jgi:superfamily II DNA/RNA helicase